MGRILFLDCFSGLSGDMFLGALVDAGLSIDRLREAVAALNLGGFSISAEKVHRGPFHATRLKVHVDGAGGAAGSGASSHTHEHTHEQAHSSDSHHHHHHHHHHDHDHHHHSHDPGAPERAGRGHVDDSGRGGIGTERRDLAAILDLLTRSSLPARVKSLATAVFERLGQAEAKVHGIPLREVHFHEVGAVDSIVDIVGSCAALHLLDIDEVHCAPVAVGTGFVHGAHGMMPLPAPATIEILNGVPIRQRDSGFELTTPTGAALAATLSKRFGTLPPMTVRSVGYGAGDDRPGIVPNLLRVIIGQAPDQPSGAERDQVVVIETHLDDISPKLLANVMQKLLEAGALDAAIAPIVMKKSRPAHRLTVLAAPGQEAMLAELLFRETTTLGLRFHHSERVVLQRQSVEVETPWGAVRVKVGLLGGEPVNAEPEFEDLKRIADERGIPLKDLHSLVLERYRRERGI